MVNSSTAEVETGDQEFEVTLNYGSGFRASLGYKRSHHMQRIQESTLEEQGAEYRVRNTAAGMEVILAGEVAPGNEQHLEAGVLGSTLSRGSTSHWALHRYGLFQTCTQLVCLWGPWHWPVSGSCCEP